MNKLDRYLDNLKEPALRQALKFILGAKKDELELNVKYVKLQVEEFAKMYPEDV